MATIINTLATLINVLSSAKNGGQFATIECESEVKLNKFPTDGTERIRIADGFKPTKRFNVQFHFGADYEKAMAKALGIADYTASDSNRRHIVPNLLMEYISTGNVCLIYMPTNYKAIGTFLNGKELSEEESAYMAHYKPKPTANILEYRTIGVKNIKRITFGGQTYEVQITEIATKVA